LLHPKARRPLKRWSSYEDLQQLSHEERSGKSSCCGKSATADTLFPREEYEKYEEYEEHKRIENVSKNQSDLMVRRSSKTSQYELHYFNSSHMLTVLNEKPKFDAKSLLRTIKINSPISLALQITKIDKQCFQQLKSAQLFSCMIGGHDLNQVSSYLTFKLIV